MPAIVQRTSIQYKTWNAVRNFTEFAMAAWAFCRTFVVRLDESMKLQEAEDLKLREIVAKSGDQLKSMQTQRDKLRQSLEVADVSIEEAEEMLSSLQLQMQSRMSEQVDDTGRNSAPGFLKSKACNLVMVRQDCLRFQRSWNDFWTCCSQQSQESCTVCEELRQCYSVLLPMLGL